MHGHMILEKKLINFYQTTRWQ